MLKLQIAARFTLWKHVNTEHVKRQHYSSFKSFKIMHNPRIYCAHWFWKIYQILERVSHKLQIDYDDRGGKQTHCGRLSRNSRNLKCLVIKKKHKGKKKKQNICMFARCVKRQQSRDQLETTSPLSHQSRLSPTPHHYRVISKLSNWIVPGPSVQ